MFITQMYEYHYDVMKLIQAFLFYRNKHGEKKIFRELFKIWILTVIKGTILKVIRFLYPELPHRQCVGLAFRRSHVHGSLSAAIL